jgi:hypothetical protein
LGSFRSFILGSSLGTLQGAPGSEYSDFKDRGWGNPLRPIFADLGTGLLTQCEDSTAATEMGLAIGVGSLFSVVRRGDEACHR